MNNPKFKAWDKKEKQWLFDGEGFAVIGEVTLFGLVDQYCAEHLEEKETSLGRLGEIETFVSTGKLDIHNREIYYDSEIVRFKLELPPLGYTELTGIFSFDIEKLRTDIKIYGNSKYNKLWYNNSTMSDFIIIGTKQENQNLLEGK
jgi:hypothetical protein